MILRNISTRTVVLRDSENTTYIVPALGDLVVSEGLWDDDEFRRWLRLRVRDIVIEQTGLAVPGSAPDTAPYVTTASDAGLTGEQLLSSLISTGTIASRPAAGISGRLYLVTDANNQRIQRDTGSSWIDQSLAWGYLTNIPSTFTPSSHSSTHQSGQADALTGNIDANAKVNVLKNGASVATRRKVNFIEGSDTIITVSDDSGNEKVDVTVARVSSIYRKVTQKEVTNTTTETDLLNGEITIAAGAMGTNKTLRASLSGDFLLNTAGASPTWRIKLGGGTIFSDIGPAIPSHANRRPWRLEFEVTNQGSAAAQYMSGTFWIGAAETAATGTGDLSSIVTTNSWATPFAHSGIAIDTSVAVPLIVTVQWDTATTSRSVRLLRALVEII